jgi:hypothetical protein
MQNGWLRPPPIRRKAHTGASPGPSALVHEHGDKAPPAYSTRSITLHGDGHVAACSNTGRARAMRQSTNCYRWPTTTPAEIEKRDRAILRLMDHRSLKQVTALSRAAGCTISGGLLPPQNKDHDHD